MFVPVRQGDIRHEMLTSKSRYLEPAKMENRTGPYIPLYFMSWNPIAVFILALFSKNCIIIASSLKIIKYASPSTIPGTVFVTIEKASMLFLAFLLRLVRTFIKALAYEISTPNIAVKTETNKAETNIKEHE